MIQLFHNERCGKSRDCMAFVINSNLEFETFEYLEIPSTFIELNLIIEKIAIKPINLVRKKEKNLD